MTTKNISFARKPAPTNLPIMDSIRQRWSPRAFDPRPIEPDKLLTLFEAARWAASSYNRQPWRFFIARKEMQHSYQQMLDVLMEGNRNWAQNAPLLGLAVVQKETEDGTSNRHAEHDTGMAMAHIALQATALDLHLHMMAGFHVEKARETYDIPANYEPMTMFAVGYYGDVEELSGKLQERERKERERKPLNEIVFAGTWENTARLVEDGV